MSYVPVRNSFFNRYYVPCAKYRERCGELKAEPNPDKKEQLFCATISLKSKV